MAGKKTYTLNVLFQGKNGVSSVLKQITRDTKTATATAFAYSTATKNMAASFGGGRLGMGGVVGLGTALYGAQAAIRGIVSESSRFEVANIQFANLIGNAELAENTLRNLFSFAATTPFEFRETQEFSKGLLAAGVNAKELIPTLRMLGDVGMGDPEKIQRLTYAYSKMRIMGKTTWRELTMFATAGVPIFEEIRNQMGLTQEELMRAVRTGKVMFGDVHNALLGLTAPGSKFQGMMIKMMDTVKGLWSNFSENLDKIAVAIGTAINPYLKTIVANMVILSNKVLEWAEANQEAIGAGFMGMAVRAIRLIMWLKDSFVQVIGAVKFLTKWALRLLPIFIGFKLGAQAMFLFASVTQFATGMMVLLKAAGVTTGLSLQAAFWPFLLTTLAIGAAIWAIYAGLKKVGLIGGGDGTGLFGDYDALFKEATSLDRMTPEGRTATSVSETTNSSRIMAQLGITLPEGAEGTLSGDEDLVSSIDINTGNQLLA